MKNANFNIGILILAAGSSSRLGHPKQLVKINGKTLLQKITETAIASDYSPVAVVLGAYLKKIKPFIENMPVHILENKNWENGMGSSIACGMNFLINKFPKLNAVVILVCDQYLLSEKNILDLVEKYKKTETDIIASKYGNTIGVPALFSKNKFEELLKLNEKVGAKKIINKYLGSTAIVDFSDGVFDLDTEEDLLKLNQVKI